MEKNRIVLGLIALGSVLLALSATSQMGYIVEEFSIPLAYLFVGLAVGSFVTGLIILYRNEKPVPPISESFSDEAI